MKTKIIFTVTLSILISIIISGCGYIPIAKDDNSSVVVARFRSYSYLAMNAKCKIELQNTATNEIIKTKGKRGSSIFFYNIPDGKYKVVAVIVPFSVNLEKSYDTSEQAIEIDVKGPGIYFLGDYKVEFSSVGIFNSKVRVVKKEAVYQKDTLSEIKEYFESEKAGWAGRKEVIVDKLFKENDFLAKSK